MFLAAGFVVEPSLVWLQEYMAGLKKQTEKVKNGEVEFYNTAFNIIRDYYFLSLIR